MLDRLPYPFSVMVRTAFPAVARAAPCEKTVEAIVETAKTYLADAFAAEPLPADSPLRCAPHTLLTPHVAWATGGALKRLMEITARNLSTFLAGKGENIVN